MSIRKAKVVTKQRETYETTGEVMAALGSGAVKITFEYTCNVDDLDLADVLDTLRESGDTVAVKVEKAEKI